MVPTILIVEGHDWIRLSTKNWLREVFQDGDVLEAKNGEEAIGIAQTYQPNVILMDTDLSDMSWQRVTRHIRSVLPSVPVILLTNYESLELQNEAVSAGVNTKILKQRMVNELIPLLRMLLKS